jgi:hypothetical protein
VKKPYLVCCGLLLLSAPGWGQLSVTALNTPYSENFNTLTASGTNQTVLPPGFSFAKSGTLTYNAGNGSSGTSAAYSFGTTGSAERAFGSVGDVGTGTLRWGFTYVNNTGYPITSLQVGYTGEQWRDGGDGQQQLTFAYTTGSAPVLTGGSYTTVNDLGFNSPYNSGTAGARDGNAVGNRTVFSPVVITLASPLAVGERILLRWEDINQTGNDHGLAIDDVQVTFYGSSAPLPVTYLDFRAIATAGQVAITWATATEQDNAGFNVERSGNARTFVSIGHVTGKGQSNRRQAYSLVDETPAPGWNYYRLRQTDTNGQFSLSRPVAIWHDGIASAGSPAWLYPNPASDEIQVGSNLPGQTLRLSNLAGQWQTLPVINGRLNVSRLPVGVYLAEMQMPDGRVLHCRLIKN